VLANPRIEDDLYSEVAIHVKFAIDRAETFSKTDWAYQMSSDVLHHIDDSQGHFVMIRGASGSGKTSLMAHLFHQISNRFGPDCPNSATIIWRCIGATPSSSSPRDLMCSILEQLHRIHTLTVQGAMGCAQSGHTAESVFSAKTSSLDLPSDFGELANKFRDALFCASSNFPLILMLDGLEEICHDEEGQVSSWLPVKMSSNLIFIISTNQSNASIDSTIQDLADRIEEGLGVFLMPETSHDDANTMLEDYLRRHGRCLSDAHKVVVMKSFQQCPSPLWIHLAAGLAISVKSYEKFEPLSISVAQLLKESMDRLELFHGFQLVKFVSCYLALSRFGLSQNELQQLLSLNDVVLADVYQWWLPPLRILPPMLLKRLLFDMKPCYLKIHQKGGPFHLFSFLHTSFVDAISTKYVSDESSRKACHFDLVNFFRGTWAGKLKPYLDVLKIKVEGFGKRESGADRLVLPQPLLLHTMAPFFSVLSVPGSSNVQNCVNLRRVDELFHHCCRATHDIKMADNVEESLAQLDGTDAPVTDAPPTLTAAAAGAPASTAGLLQQTLSDVCSLQYFFAKCASGRLRDLMHELRWLNMQQHSLDPHSKKIVADYARFLALNVHVFKGKAEVILQQALVLPSHMSPACEAQELVSVSSRGALLCPVHAGQEKTLVLCNLQHPRQVRDICFVAGTCLLASLSSDSSVKLFDHHIGEQVWECLDPDGALLSLGAVCHREDAAQECEANDPSTLSPKLICIIGGGDDGSIYKWLGAPRSMIKTIRRHQQGAVRKLLFISNITILALTERAGKSAIVSVHVDTLGVSNFYRHDIGIADFCVSHDNTLLVIGDDAQVSCLICMETQSVLHKIKHEHTVKVVAVSSVTMLCATGMQAKRAGAGSCEMGGITLYCGPIQVWDIKTGLHVALLRGHDTAAINSLSFARNGKFLVSVSHDWQGPKVWDCSTWECLLVMTQHSQPAVTAQISPDFDDTVVSADSMGTIKVWKIESCTGRRHAGTVRHLTSCSHDGRFFISAGADSSVRLFEIDSDWTLKQVLSMTGQGKSASGHTLGHTSDANRLSITSDFCTMVSSSDDKSVIVWALDAASGRLTDVERLPAAGWLECVAITSQGHLIAAGDNFGTIKMWQFSDGSWNESEIIATIEDFVLPEECRPTHISHATGDNVGCINISFSSDMLLVSRGDGMMGTYTLQSTQKFGGGLYSSVAAHEITRSDGLVEVFADFLSDSESVVSVGDTRLRLWDIQSKPSPNCVSEYELNGAGRRFICGTDTLVVSTWNGWVQVFCASAASGSSISTSNLHWCRFGLTPLANLWHGSRVDGFILNHQLPVMLVYGDDDGNIGIWKLLHAASPPACK